jgi:hypothetical protein
MKAFLAAVGCLALMSCGAAREPLEFGATSTEGLEGRIAHDVAVELGGQEIPDSYQNVILSSPTYSETAIYRVVPFREYRKMVDDQELGKYAPANSTDLLAFQRAYRLTEAARNLQDVCAPLRLFLQNGQDQAAMRGSWMFAVSNKGQNYGLFQQPKSCKYALLVRSIS